MQLDREVILKASAPEVWAVLWDVPRMVECVPGCVEAREIEPGRSWEALVSQRAGPIALSLPLLVRASEAEAPRRLGLEARGRDPIVGASVSVRLGIELEPEDPGTRVRIHADVQVRGKLGALGHSAVRRKADETLDGFIERLRRAVEG